MISGSDLKKDKFVIQVKQANSFNNIQFKLWNVQCKVNII